MKIKQIRFTFPAAFMGGGETGADNTDFEEAKASVEFPVEWVGVP